MNGRGTKLIELDFVHVSQQTRIFVSRWDRRNSYDNNQPNHHKVDLKEKKKLPLKAQTVHLSQK